MQTRDFSYSRGKPSWYVQVKDLPIVEEALFLMIHRAIPFVSYL